MLSREDLNVTTSGNQLAILEEGNLIYVVLVTLEYV